MSNLVTEPILKAGEDPCATILRANLKEILLDALQSKFELPRGLSEHACIRIFGSTLIRLSSASFPFADRKSEDLDLELYCQPGKIGSQQAIDAYAPTLRSLASLIEKLGIRILPKDGRSIEQSIDYASRPPVAEVCWALSFEFPVDLLPVLCGKYSQLAVSNTATLDLSITPPQQITVLTLPKLKLDPLTHSKNPAVKFDSPLHHVSKALVRSLAPNEDFIPHLHDPSTFRPTDVLNVFNYMFAVNPGLLNFRLNCSNVPERYTQSPGDRTELIFRNDALLELRLLTVINFAVFGKNTTCLDEVNLQRFDSRNEAVTKAFSSALAPFLGRVDLTEKKKIQAILNGYLALILEVFPPFLDGAYPRANAPWGVTLLPAEREFIDRAAGSVASGVEVCPNLLKPLFASRYGNILEQKPEILEALSASASIRSRASRFEEMAFGILS